MLKIINLGDSANTTALTAYPVSDLEEVYVSIDGTFSATGTVEITADGGTTWEAYGSSTCAKALIGPLPPCQQVRGKNSARASGTVSYRLGANANHDDLRLPTGETVCGKFADITSAAACAAKSVAGCGTPKVWVKSADFVGTYSVEVSFDGGTTWAHVKTPVVVSSGATSDLVTCPRATHVRIEATAFTSGTLSGRYGARKEPQVG